MKILKREPQVWRLRLETEDDLWALARMTRKGMQFAMLGERRDQTTGGEEGGRAKSAERKKMWIRLRVESTEYQTFSEHLRVHGIIEEAHFDIGMYHTHLVEIRDEVEISTQNVFTPADVELLLQSEKASGQSQVVLAVVETDEVVIFHVTARGLREGATWTMRGGGKRGEIRHSESIASTFRSNVIKALVDTLGSDTPLIVCGPGHARDALLSDLKSTGQTRIMKSIATSMGGRAGANEVLREGLAGNLLSEYAISKEIALIEESWKRLSTGGAVAYGEDALVRAMEEGAIETLLISADLLRSETDRIAGKTWLEWTKGLADIGAEMVQCSIDHDGGQQLMGLGGVMAMLRYTMEG
ncbi:MAG: pelota family protein [Euryarchaeota archaeon]|jgi:protein pelota|nr:pelota family protein [Euryarchaeota archaeon]